MPADTVPRQPAARPLAPKVVDPTVRQRLLIDPAIPDAIAHAGYVGTLDRSAQRTAEERILREAGFSMLDRVWCAPDVAYYRFPNGWGAGVLLGSDGHPACSGCTPGRPFEMAILHGRGTPGKLCRASGISEDVVCDLDAAGVGATLDEIAALAPKTGCAHARQRR